jgi:mono/diheme cytochrome c family protein
MMTPARVSVAAVGTFAFVLTAAPALAQEVDQALLDAGAQLYEENCALCHQPEGEGDPPTFPALSGNANLEDLPTIVGNIHQGQGNMPPFPDLDAGQIAALATYIRNSWGNSFGGAAEDEVATILTGLEVEGEQRTIWDAVYTEEQAARGEDAYTGPCNMCHGRRLNGAPDDPDMPSAPPLARIKFLQAWNGKSLATLFEFTRATMPQSNPGHMEDQEYADIIAYMLSVSEVPAGDEELPVDPQALARIVITEEP